MHAQPLVEATAVPATRSVATGLGALFAGALMLALVGFAPIAAVHNAAHDTRHSAAFPCH